MSVPADEIAFLGRCLEGTDIELLELASGQRIVRLRRDAAGRVCAPPAPASGGTFDVAAPTVGVFRRGHPLRTAPLAREGQRVREGDPIGLLQIGALLVHAVAPRGGIVMEVLAEDGATVGYGTALVRVAEEGEP